MAASTNVTYIKLSASTAYRLVAGEISYQNISATEIILDAYSINQYPKDAFGFLDTSILSFTKASFDTFELTELQSISLVKAVADTLALGDVVELIWVIQRDFNDSTTISDVSVIGVNKALSEALSFSESALIQYQANKTDSISFSDTQALAVNLNKVETVTVTDLFSRPTTFNRSFTDAFALDDSFSTGLSYLETKANVLSLSDSFTFTMILGNNSVLNASTLNTFTLNR